MVLHLLEYMVTINPANFGCLELDQVGFLSCELSSFRVSCFDIQTSQETGDEFYAATVMLRTAIRGFTMKLEVFFRGIKVATTVMDDIHRPFTGKACV